MTTEDARKFILLASLGITGLQMVFLFAAPAFGFPLTYPRNLDLLQIVAPVFFGYLGSAAHFVFRTPAPTVPANNELLGILTRGPIAIYVVAMAAAFGAFAYSNRAGASPGTGMAVENLATATSIALGLLAVTTGILVSYLFVTDQNAAKNGGAPPPPASENPKPEPAGG